MSKKTTLVQFLAPWQGQSGFKRYALSPESKTLKPFKSIRREKMLRKAAKKVDGLLLRGTWPSSRAMILIRDENGVRLGSVSGNHIDGSESMIDIEDPTFEMKIVERILYRKFIFKTATRTLTFADFAGRLIGPYRVATEVFPPDDFSPFARLIAILRNPEHKRTFVADLERRRFKYSRWVDQTSDLGSPEGLNLAT